MELKLFAGPLTRFYTRPDEAGDAPSAADVLPAVCAWRDTIAAGAGDQIDQEIYWEEAADLPALTTEPTWAGWYALVLCALAQEQGAALTDTGPGWMERFEQWPVWQAAQQPGYASRYPSLCRSADLWLPVEEDLLITGPDPSGEIEMTVSAVGSLWRELTALGSAMWRLTPETAGEPLPVDGDSFEEAARRAYTHVCRALQFARRHHCPLLLDY